MADNIKNVAKNSEASDEIDIGQLLGTLFDNKWLIVSVTTLFAIFGIVYVLFATPIYSADSLVQIEQKLGSSILDNINSILPDAKPASQAEIELIQSRMILGKTIKDLNLDVVVENKYLPVFGAGWQRLTKEHTGDITISEFDVPADLMNKQFVVKVISRSNYELIREGKVLLKGQVGKLEDVQGVLILIKSVNADKDSEFYVTKYPVIAIINQIQMNLAIQETAKDSGVLSLVYTGQDPVMIQRTLDRITQNYLAQNIERKSEEAQKSLDFLNVEVPKTKKELNEAEDKLNLYREQNDTVDLSLEAKSVLDSIVNIDSQLNQLTFKEAEISKLYTKEHPAYRTLLEQRQTLLDEKQKLMNRVSQMPKTQQDILRLTRDVQANQDLYTQLVDKQQEFNITRASTVADVRIIDKALTEPGVLSPKKGMIIAASIFLGILVSLFWVIVKTILSRGIENIAALEEVGINVYASIPLSEWQQRKDKELALRNKDHKKIRTRELLAIGNPTDLAIESIRSLRTSLHFAMLEAKNNILMITGASPSIGKTFICANLAVVIAQTDKKVLLIDSDMRKGYMHELLDLTNNEGLSDLLSGQIEYEKIIKNTTVNNLDIVTRGMVPPNPSELLMGERLDNFLEWANSNYDLILIDTPPILAVTDAAIVGHNAGTSLLVVRFGVNTVKEVELSINRFSQNGINIKGVILNSVYKKASNYYGEYGYYEYDYK